MPTRVFLGNLPENLSDQQVRDVFDPFGEITEVKLIKNYGFLDFTNEDDAKKAVKDMHNTHMSGNTIIVDISKGKKSDGGRKDDRRDDRRDRGRDRRGNDRNRDNAPHNRVGGPPMGMDIFSPGILPPPNNLVAALGALAGQQPLGNQMQPPQQQQQASIEDRPHPDVRVRREAVHVRHVPGADRMGITDGYVIYERYYVDPNHALLKEAPRKMPRVEDTFVAPRQDVPPKTYDNYEPPRSDDPYAALSAPQAANNYGKLNGSVNPYGRERSPIRRDQPVMRSNDYATRDVNPYGNY